MGTVKEIEAEIVKMQKEADKHSDARSEANRLFGAATRKIQSLQQQLIDAYRNGQK